MPSLKRYLLIVLVAVPGCAGWMGKLTPAGIPCTDMQVIPYGQTIDRPFQRFAVVKSTPADESDMERIVSLRRDACNKGGDAVVDAATEQKRTPTGDMPVATGMAVRFLRAVSKPTAAKP